MGIKILNNRIVLVNPTVRGEKEIIDYPLGLAYLASALRSNGMQVEIIDLFYRDDEIIFLNKIFIDKPIIVGLTCTTPTFSDILTLAAKVKRIHPKACVVLGGHHVTKIAEMILEKYKQINCIVLYEGEETICQLSSALSSQNINDIKKIDGIAYRFSDNSIYINRIHKKLDLSKYPFPAWDLIISPEDMIEYFHKKQASITTMRGCWGSCSFCDSRCVSRINYKNLDDVGNEIDFLIEKYGVEFIYIQDLDFLKNKKRALLISEMMRVKGIKKFQIITRADSLVDSCDILETICDNGCGFIEVGIESGCISQLNRYNKNIVVDVNSKAIIILKGLFKKYNLSYSISFIMFDPFVTLEELTENYNFFIRNSIDNNDNERWLFSVLDIFPGTKMHMMAYEKQLAYENGDDINSLYYNFKKDDVAFFYSYIYSFSKFVYPMVKKARETISKLISEGLLVDTQSKIHLRGLYISINAICFKYFKELLDASPDKYNEVYDKFKNKSNKVLENLKGWCYYGNKQTEGKNS